MGSVSILIPVYNEEETIVLTHSKVSEALEFGGITDYTIVFINDCSTDISLERLDELASRNSRVKIISHVRNTGKGGALKSGLSLVDKGMIVLGDADMELDPMQIPELLQPIMKGEVEFVNGSRFLNAKQTQFRDYIHALFSILFSLLAKKRITDFACGFKAFNKTALDGISLQENGFAIEAELMMKACKRKIPMKEIRVNYNPRTKKQGKKFKNADALRILLAFFKYRFSG